MSESAAGNAGARRGLNKPPSLAPYADLLRFSFFNATTWLIALGTPLVLLASELGASSFEVGLIYSFVFLLLPVQILATALLPRFGYKRQIIAAWLARGSALVIPFWLALQAPTDPPRWMVLALIASSFLFAFFRSFGSCALPPLMYAILPEKVRGRYFSTDQAVTGIAGILTLVLCAAMFRYLPPYTAFAWQYGYATFAVFMTVYYLSRVKDPPKPEATSLKEVVSETPVLCLRRSPFRQYLVFMTTYALVGTAFVPLKAYYLNVELDLGVDRILLYTAVQYCGAILGTMIMRNRIDRIGVKPVFRLSLIIGACVSTYWYFLVTGQAPELVAALPVAYFFFGVSASQWATAHLKYIPRVCDESRQALHVSVHSAVIGVIGGLAPILWGFLVKVPGLRPGVKADTFALFFLAYLVTQLVLFSYVPRLTSRYRSRPSLQMASSILRPFRYVGQMVNIIPEKKEEGRKD